MTVLTIFRKLVLFTLLMVLVLPPIARGSETKSLTLLYQGDFMGYVDGCG